MSIQTAVNQIKRLIEDSIKLNGVEGKNAIIRSQRPINLLHDAIKLSFIKDGVNLDYINPKYGEHTSELKLAGYFKQKDQDYDMNPESWTINY